MSPEQKPILRKDEIDLLELSNVIWLSRKLILKITAGFVLFGLIIALGSGVEYKASCKLMPESQEDIPGNLGGLSGLAGLAGLNFGGQTAGVLTPELYPEIAKSTSFQLELLHEPILFEEHDTLVSSYVYFKEIYSHSFLANVATYTLGLPSIVKGWFTGPAGEVTQDESSDLIRLSSKDLQMLQVFRKRTFVDVDIKSGIIFVSTKMPEAFASAALADKVIELLTEKVVDYKISKSKANLEFISERFKESKAEFERAQNQMALFDDRNRNVSTSLARTEQQRLQNEYNIAFEVYKGLATQLEQAKIKVKEQTPVFTTLEPVVVPIDKSEPKRKIILLVSIMAGVALSLAFVLIRHYYFKQK